MLLCAEYTGQYTWPLSCACEEMQVDLWLENPAQIRHGSVPYICSVKKKNVILQKSMNSKIEYEQ
jgi:hypothetical protein